MCGSTAVLTDEDRSLLLSIRRMLEEITDTLEIMEDEEAISSIKEAQEDMKAGRVRDYDEFVGELRGSW